MLPVRGPLTEPSAWRADQLWPEDWIRTVTPDHQAELEAALAAGDGDFVLPTFGAVLVGVREELLSGRGFALLRGLDVSGWSVADAERAWWAIGAHIGTPVAQSAAGELIGHVRDTGRSFAEDPDVRGYQTNLGAPFHTDGADVAGLLCLQTAKAGGRSSMISSMTLYNVLLDEHPDLLEVLFEPFCFDNRGQQPGRPWSELPIFTWHEGYLSALYKRPYIELAQRFEGVPRLTERQVAALDALDAACARPGLALEMDFHPGDMQFVNNFCVFHARSGYEDWDDPERKRHLLRLWLAMPDGRPLPPAFAGGREFMDVRA